MTEEVQPDLKYIKEQCSYCKRYFKGSRGVGIHQHYCSVKRFADSPVVEITRRFLSELLSDSNFIPSHWLLPIEKVAFLRSGEVGCKYYKNCIIRFKVKRYH